MSFEFHTRQWHQASRGHASHRAGHCHVPSGPAPFLYTEKWPHCKRMPCPSLPQGSPGPLHVPASQVSLGFTYVVGKMKTQYFFQLGNLDYALQSLFATWFEGSAVPLGSREVGQMVLMKAGCFLGPFSTEQGGLQQFEWVEHSPSSVHYKYYCLKVRKKSEIITTSFSHNP